MTDFDGYLSLDENDEAWQKWCFGRDRSELVLVADAVMAIGPIRRREIPALDKPGGKETVFSLKVYMKGGAFFHLDYRTEAEARSGRERLMVKVDGIRK